MLNEKNSQNGCVTQNADVAILYLFNIITPYQWPKGRFYF